MSPQLQIIKLSLPQLSQQELDELRELLGVKKEKRVSKKDRFANKSLNIDLG